MAELDQLALSPPRFVGRERELATLQSTLSRLPAVVLIEGEAGIGKSRLLTEFLASPAARRRRVLVTGCPPYRESLTLGPVVDAMRQARDSLSGLQLSALAGALRPLFPEWAADLPPAPEPLDDAKAARHRLFRAVAELVCLLGIDVLVVEDIHWADDPTVEFLLFVTTQQNSMPSVVVTYRPEEVPTDSLLLRLSARRPVGAASVRITLSPLTVEETAALVSSMLSGEPVTHEFARFLHDETDGLPLAVEESIRLLHDRADLVRQHGHWMRLSLEELQVPPTVRDAVLERLQRLSSDTRRVLEAAAVLTEPAHATAIRDVAGLTTSQTRTALETTLASGLLQHDKRGRFGFRHVLVGRAVYEAIPSPERRRLHLAAGNVLEATLPVPVVQLTRHLREANDIDRWCAYAELAAKSAIASNDYSTATAVLHDVITTAELTQIVRNRLAHQLAAAALCRSEQVDQLHSDVVTALRDVLEAGGLSPEEEAEIRSPLGRLLMQQSEFEAGAIELEHAIAHLDHLPEEAAKAMMALAWPSAGRWPAAVHLQWVRRAAEVTPASLSPADRLALTADRAAVLLLLGDNRGWAVADELPTDAVTAEERRQITRGCSNIGFTAIIWGRYADARRRLTAALKLVEADSLPRFRRGILAALAHLDWFAGNWDGLAERLDELTDPDGATDRLAYLEAIVVAGLVHLARGGRSKAEDHFRFALDETHRLHAMPDVLEPSAALARLLLLDGRVDDALRITDEPMRIVMTKRIWLWATEIAPARVEALAFAGRVEEATRLVAMFARGLRGRDGPAARAALATCRAILAEVKSDPTHAAAAFTRAARAWERLPRPYDALLARERQARCMLAGNDPQRGLALLSEVFQGFSAFGATGDAHRVARHLREHGLDVRQRGAGRPSYGDNLSPRELDVVRLLVTGRTDREIAAALFLSAKTVAGHIASARRKLRAPSRTALAVIAVEQGVLHGGLDGDVPRAAFPSQ